MGSPSKCCWFVNMDRGCHMIGYASLLFTMALTCASIAPLAIDNQQLNAHNDTSTLARIEEKFNLHISRLPMRTILIVAAIIGVTGVVASITLILGLIRNVSGFVLCYFGYGISFAIVTLLGALLELLHSYWITALVEILICLVYIHCLCVVYTAYEAMQRGKYFESSGHHSIDEDNSVLIDENEQHV